MAFEDLLRLQSYLRGDGRNPMAEAIQQRGARQRQLEDRELRRGDIFESQRRAQEFQAEQAELGRSFQERLTEKQADAYLKRLKEMQNLKLRGSYPKKENETDEQWEERVGKAQAEPVNRLLEDASDARKRAGEILKEQAKRKQGEVLKHARLDSGFLSTVESLDANTATAIRGGASPEAAIQELAKKSKEKAAKALSAYELTISKYAGTDDKGNPLIPDVTPQAIDEYNSLKEAEKMASEQAAGLIKNVYESHGDFLGAKHVKSIARELLGPRVAPSDGGEGSLKPEDFRPSKTSPGGSPGAGGKPAIVPGAGSVPPPQSSAPVRLPGAGVVPTFLNENVIEPVAKYLPIGAQVAAAPFRDVGTALGNAGRYLFTGAPQQPYEVLTPPPRGQPFGLAGVVPVPPPGQPLQGRGASGSWDAPSPPGAMNVTTYDLQEFMANELGMDPDQIQAHFQEKAQGNPEAAEAERELLADIMRRRAMPPPMEPALMR